jgi:adenine-specific DNA-methyltransferase
MLEISKENNIIGATFSSTNPNIYSQFKKDQDGEVFEKVVFDLMLNKYSDDADLSDYILSLPNDKQRMALLSLIDGDSALWSKMNSYVNECSDKFEHIKDVIKIMSKFVKDGEVERKKFAEVMTPLELVKEMLNTLPKEVWSNPDLKWLDPANGAGTFPYVVIYKLMKGLSEWEPDTEKRYKHIVENMIYTCELQSRNVFLWLCGVDPKNEYTTNSYWGSFLDDGFDYHMKNVWDVDKFDIIIGNPPYQDNNKNGGIQPKNHNLWSKFITKSIDILKDSGFLLYVTPDSWRSPSSKILELFKSNTLLFTNFDVAKYFPGVGSTFSYYLLKIGKHDQECKIYGIDVDMNKLKYIPNGGELSLSIHLKTIMSSSEKYNLLCDTTSNHSSSQKSNLSKLITDKNIHRLHHTNAQEFFSTKKSKNHDDKKVYFTISGYFSPKYDDGNISTSEICPYILVNDENEGLNLVKILKSKIYTFLVNTGKWSGFLNKDILRCLPKLNLNKDWTEEEICKELNLTEEEIIFINNF